MRVWLVLGLTVMVGTSACSDDGKDITLTYTGDDKPELVGDGSGSSDVPGTDTPQPDNGPDVTVDAIACVTVADCGGLGDLAPCYELACIDGTCQTQPVPDGSGCDDFDPCTDGETCQAGTCGGGTDTCATCESADDCPAPSSPCVEAACDADQGCFEVPANEGAACDLGSACYDDGAGTCSGGVCEAPQGDPCDDGNPCTDDVCDPIKGCGSSPNTASCDDGNPCTDGDTCADGACEAGGGICGCSDDADCAGDGFDPCLGPWTCAAGNCEPAGPKDCSALDAGPCEVGACDSATGDCVTTQLEAGEPCDDGDACTSDTVCDGAASCGGDLVDCDDGNPCTDDSCDPSSGCVNTPNSAACDDGDACTTGDVCADGQCGGLPIVCEGSGPCVSVSCDPVDGCTAEPLQDGASCDDGDDCTSGDACEAGSCVGAPACDCVVDSDCPDDGDACNGVPVCSSEGLCETDPATIVTCGPVGACETAVCDPQTGECSTEDKADGTGCDAGACKQQGACMSGVCEAADQTCDDGNPCTADSCDAATDACVNEPLSGDTCDDGDPCTLTDVCDNGTCVGGAPDDCDDGDACTTDSCAPGVGCSNAPVPCDDGDPCTTDTCDPTAGCVSQPVVCQDDGNPCTVEACDPATATCASTPAGTGGACDDDDACTTGDTCDAAGTCSGAAVDCDDGDPCTADSCDALVGCVYAPQAGGPCDDGDACTTGDACNDSGTCAGAPVNCDDTDACTADSCDSATGQCVNTPVPSCGACQGLAAGSPCDDGDASTFADFCSGATCAGFSAHPQEGGPLTGELWYDHVNHAADKWFVTGGVNAGFGGPAYGISDADDPDAISPYFATITQQPFRDIEGGFAVRANGNLLQYGAQGWSLNNAYNTALAASGNGSPYAIWSYPSGGTTVLFAAGEAGGNPWIRRCAASSTANGINCASQQLTDNGSRPRAMKGRLICSDPVGGSCSPLVVIGADFSAGNGNYFNDTWENVGGTQNPWASGYFDQGPAGTQTRDAVVRPDGSALVVGTQGYMRYRSAAGSWGNVISGITANQGSRNFTGVWFGAGVVVVSAWSGGNTKTLELWVAGGKADLTQASSWFVHQLDQQQGDNAGLFDVWGTSGGEIRAVGTGDGDDNTSDGLMYVRSVP